MRPVLTLASDEGAINLHVVIPAKAGIQLFASTHHDKSGIPAFAG